MSALLFITLLVGLTYAAEECKVNEGHCSKCEDECYCECCAEGYTQSGSEWDPVKCNYCAEGYVKDGDNCVKCADANCVKCDAKGEAQCTKCASGYSVKESKCIKCADHCTKCSEANKCDPDNEDGTSNCEELYYYKADTQTCVACEDSKCVACSGAGTKQCTKCKDGYKLDGGECKTKYDCTKNKVTNCGECSGEEADATCYECKDGYKFDDYQSDKTKKCVEEDKLTKCEWTYEECGVKEEGKTRYQEDLCYERTGYNTYYKVEGGKKCYYTDSACKDRVKEQDYLDVTDKCIRLKDKSVEPGVDKWYQYKKSDKKCESGEVKEYTKEDCSGDGTNEFESICRKVEEGEYENKYVMTSRYSPYFALYEDKECKTKIEKGDAECEPGPCSGSVMNIIMLTVLIISFMI